MAFGMNWIFDCIARLRAWLHTHVTWITHYCFVTCLETYKDIKAMHCSETWINLIYINFYTLLAIVSYWKNARTKLRLDPIFIFLGK